VPWDIRGGTVGAVQSGTWIIQIASATGKVTAYQGTDPWTVDSSSPNALVTAYIKDGGDSHTVDGSSDSFKVTAYQGTTPYLTNEYGSANSYIEDENTTSLTSSYQLFSFGFTARALILVSDCTNYLKFNFGVSTGTVKGNEVVTLENIRQTSVKIKGESGLESYRLIVW